MKEYKRKNVKITVGQVCVEDAYDAAVLRKMVDEIVPECQYIYGQDEMIYYVTIVCGTRSELEGVSNLLRVLDELGIYYETDFELPTKV